MKKEKAKTYTRKQKEKYLADLKKTSLQRIELLNDLYKNHPTIKILYDNGIVSEELILLHKEYYDRTIKSNEEAKNEDEPLIYEDYPYFEQICFGINEKTAGYFLENAISIIDFFKLKDGKIFNEYHNLTYLLEFAKKINNPVIKGEYIRSVLWFLPKVATRQKVDIINVIRKSENHIHELEGIDIITWEDFVSWDFENMPPSMETDKLVHGQIWTINFISIEYLKHLKSLFLKAQELGKENETEIELSKYDINEKDNDKQLENNDYDNNSKLDLLGMMGSHFAYLITEILGSEYNIKPTGSKCDFKQTKTENLLAHLEKKNVILPKVDRKLLVNYIIGQKIFSSKISGHSIQNYSEIYTTLNERIKDFIS